MSGRLGGVGFLLLHGAVAAAAIAAGVARHEARAAARALPPLREAPLSVAPLYDEPEVVALEDLERVARRVVLDDRGPATSIAQVEHLLRLWGREATFADPSRMSGFEMIALLLNHLQFERTYEGSAPPFLVPVEGGGIRPRLRQGRASSSHVDHTLAALAEIEVPRGFPVLSPAGDTAVDAILRQSLADFRLDQVETEWSTLVYALFLPPATGFVAADGQAITFDRLAERLMREALPRGVCSGHHRLHALTVLLRVDGDRDPPAPRLLSPPVRAEVVRFLRRATDLLVASQQADGSWEADWPGAGELAADPDQRLDDRIIVTGHALEWWALAPPELLPERTVITAAAGWVVGVIDRLDESQIEAKASFLSHAVRALALWRGRQAAALLAPPAAAADAVSAPPIGASVEPDAGG